MATKISAYSEGNRFFLCFEDCDPETAKQVGDFVLNVLKVPMEQTEGFVVNSDDAPTNNPFDFPVFGTSGTLDIAIKRRDTKSIINTLIRNKDIPADTLIIIKKYLLSYIQNIERKMPIANSGEALLYIQTIQPLCKKAISDFLLKVSPDVQYTTLAAYYASGIKNAHNILLKYLVDDLKNRLAVDA